MSQNLISLSFSDEELSILDEALNVVETRLSGLLSLQATQRRKLMKMGEKSEMFCRQTLVLLAQNPQIVPSSLGLADAEADVIALDLLRPRLHRLKRLVERGEDSEMALGSDIITTALEGYNLLKVSGKKQGLDRLRRELSSRFSKSPRAVEPIPTQAEAL
jgi:hypothetical protein